MIPFPIIVEILFFNTMFMVKKIFENRKVVKHTT